jgi:hypothetical protein
MYWRYGDSVRTARVWRGPTAAVILSGHSLAVWAVLAIDTTGEYLTGMFCRVGLMIVLWCACAHMHACTQQQTRPCLHLRHTLYLPCWLSPCRVPVSVCMSCAVSCDVLPFSLSLCLSLCHLTIHGLSCRIRGQDHKALAGREMRPHVHRPLGRRARSRPPSARLRICLERQVHPYLPKTSF